MADIEFTHTGYGLLQISGRVGQTVSITVDGGPNATYATVFLKPLPVGLIYDYTTDLITGTLLTTESHSYIDADGPMLRKYDGLGVMVDVDGQVDVIAAVTTPASVAVDDLTAILAAINTGGEGATTVDPNLPDTDPNGSLNGTNAEGDISVPIDFDLTTDQVFIPDGYSLPTAGEASTVALPDWAKGTFSIGSIMSVKEGDRFPVAIGFLRPSELIEVGGITSIEIFARERAGEKRYDLSEAGYVLMDGVTRYKVILNLQGAALKDILKSYESPNGAYVDLMTEIRLTVTIPAAGSAPESVLVRTSHTFALRFEQKMGD